MLSEADSYRVIRHLFRAQDAPGTEMVRMTSDLIHYEPNQENLREFKQAAGSLRGLANTLRAPQPLTGDSNGVIARICRYCRALVGLR
jgi:hypothetical protein